MEIDTKYCSGCEQDKPLDQFSQRRIGEHQTKCKECCNKLNRANYQRRKAEIGILSGGGKGDRFQVGMYVCF